MNVLKFNRYKFIYDNIPDSIIKEGAQFSDMQPGGMALGGGYGFASDPNVSLHSDDTSPYTDSYTRMSMVIQDLNRVMKNLYAQGSTSIDKHKIDYFLEDLDDYNNLKILRTYVNSKMLIDVFISFDFLDEEFFGVFRDFNGLNKPTLKTDLFTDLRFNYIDKEYRIKLSNYFYKILFNWFIPDNGDYIILSDELKVKNSLGSNINFKKGMNILVKGYNTDVNGNPFLIIHSKDNIYKIQGNDFFYFKYRCKKIN